MSSETQQTNWWYLQANPINQHNKHIDMYKFKVKKCNEWGVGSFFLL